MSYIGREVFSEYRKAKRKYRDFNTWCAEAVREEYGTEMEGPLMAAKICNTTHLPWTNAVVFENIVLVLNGREALPDVDQDITVKEIAFAVKCLKEEFPEEEYGDAVKHYVAAEAGEEGIALLPSELLFAQKYIPALFLSPEQQDIQEAYLDEIKTYVETMSNSSIISSNSSFGDEIMEAD